MTFDARKALARSAVWFGYGLYLDFLEPLRRHDQVRIDGKLTLEKDRCLKALELAQQGVKVSLVSSGDSGIYGMAGLALELWLDKPINERPFFEVHPGVSAIQIAASRVGAPLANDFCAISLSDRLTPWKTIEERLQIVQWVQKTKNVLNRAYLEELLELFGVELIDLERYRPIQCTAPCTSPVNTESLRFKVKLILKAPIKADMACIIENYLPAYVRYDIEEKV